MTDKRPSFRSDPWVKYAIIMVGLYAIFYYVRIHYTEIVSVPIIARLKILESYPAFMTNDDIELNKSFVEWFGVLYGFLLPLILIKVWEQFETLERNFDKEADSVRAFAEDVMLLPNDMKDKKVKMLFIAKKYAEHIQDHYIQEGSKETDSKKGGDEIINKLRTELSTFFNSKKNLPNLAPLLSHLLNQLNTIIDVRGDRISNSKQRLFSGLRWVAGLASFVWLIPFYFLDLELGLYGDGLVLAVTILIVYVLHKIEDLDEPFYRKWRLEKSVWKNLEDHIQSQITTLL